jgi:hypothetical protein
MPSGIPPSVRQQTATNLKSLLTDENGSVLTDPIRLGEIQSDLRKQAIAESARGGMTSDILTNTRNAINDALDKATGGKYSAARLQYRNDMAVPEAFQRHGRRISPRIPSGLERCAGAHAGGNPGRAARHAHRGRQHDQRAPVLGAERAEHR